MTIKMKERKDGEGEVGIEERIGRDKRAVVRE